MLSNDITESLVEQVKEAIRVRSPLVIEGGGSKGFYGYPQPIDLQRLHMIGHQGVIDYSPDELVIHVRAGTALSEVNQLLEDNSQMLAFEPPDFGGIATMGGVIASALSGPRRPYAGSVRDFVLGVTLITGQAEVLSFGGQVMKNVAGYDVSRLVTGALGTLGVILDVSLKVLPAPELELTRTIPVARHGFQALLQSMNRNIPISAAAHENGELRFRVSGSETAVKAALKELEAEEAENSYWDQLNNLELFVNARQLWRVSVAPGSSSLLEEAALVDWGGGLRWVVEPEVSPRAVLACEGHATLMKYDSLDSGLDIFHPLIEPVAGIHRRLKQQFDPERIFNPGRMYREF
ncbi:MAG: glycolate oxidase subunit GlcE [Gammaproteobacteria bacterium]|nr:glycolate oxidase subunit GlcE [Gammaproteobacteria bacterium]